MSEIVRRMIIGVVHVTARSGGELEYESTIVVREIHLDRVGLLG
jgi:hypothetical protein